MAMSCASVAPLSAARVAAILRTPCAEPGTLKGCLQDGQDWQRDLYGKASLLRFDRRNSIADMLTPNPHRITPTQITSSHAPEPRRIDGYTLMAPHSHKRHLK